MLFSPNNLPRIHVLSNAYAEALGIARSALSRKLSVKEDDLLKQNLTRNLMDAHDSGERDPGALTRAALQGVLVTGTTD